MREELHHLIDQLPEEQASGKGDVAARSQEILREEMGRDVR